MSLSQQTKSAGLKNYLFPSGGGFYPLETYLVIHNIENYEPGLYHYSSTEHTLACIKKYTTEIDSLHKRVFPQMKNVPQVFILMTMVKSRCIQKYGALSYYLSLVESGHRGQNIYLAASALKLNCRAFGFNDYHYLNQFLEIDGTNEHYVYGLGISETTISKSKS